MSNDEIGLVLVGLTVFFALAGYALSRLGLNEVKTAAQQTQNAIAETNQTLAAAHQTLAQETGRPAADVAASTTAVAAKTTVISDQLAQVNEALAGLTGRQAPARVAWALATLCLVAAFVAFDLVSLAVAPDAVASGG